MELIYDSLMICSSSNANYGCFFSISVMEFIPSEKENSLANVIRDGISDGLVMEES